MLPYILRRILAVIPTVLGISILVFLIMHMIPGDTISAMIGTKFKLTDAQMAALREYFGLDRPLWEQYLRWLWNALRGNFGFSVRSGQPVAYEILSRIPLTLELTFVSVFLGLGVGIPVGIWSAINQGRLADWIGKVMSMIGLAMPSFWLGTLIIYALSVYFHVLPNAGNFVDFTQNPIQNLKQIFFPAVVLAFDFCASIIRTTWASMLEEIHKDYILTARAKGLTNRAVNWVHCLRNALIPVITLIGLQTGYLFGGAIIVENIFSIPGLGRLLLNAINQRDYALVQGSIVFVAAMFVMVNLAADLAYAVADPRINMSDTLAVPTGQPSSVRVNRYRRYLKNGNFMAGLVLTSILLLMGIFAPVIAPYSPIKQNPKDRLQAPSAKYWMGTDEFGRDITSRIIYGGANSLRISIVSVLAASITGTLLGVICAYLEGKTDYLIMRVMDLLFAFPTILLALAISAALGPGFINTVVAISIVYTPIFTRVARGSVLHIKRLEYVTAATSLGAPHWHKIVQHILPNAIGPSIVQVSMAFSWAILTESALSYLGLGTQPPAPSWGGMISESRRMMEIAPWMAIFPGLAIMVTVLSFNLLGDGLRDILDPRAFTRKP